MRRLGFLLNISLVVALIAYEEPRIEFSRMEEAKQLMMDYSSMPEMIDHVVDEVVFIYPSLHPGSEEMMLHLKRDISDFLSFASEEEKAELIAGRPSKFEYLAVAWKKLKEIGKKDKAWDDEEQEFKEYNEDLYILFKFSLHHALSFLEMKEMMYKEEAMTKDQIIKDIETKSMELMEMFHKGDPRKEEMKKAVKERIRKMHVLWFVAFLTVSSAAAYEAPMIRFDRLDDVMEMMEKYSCPIMMIDSVVGDLCRVYPVLYPGSDQKMNLLKSEVSLFWVSSEQEKAEFFAGFPSNFKYLSAAWEKLKEIGKKDKPWTEDEQEMRDKSETQYVLFKLGFHHLINHLDDMKKTYEEMGFSEEDIKKDIGRTAIELTDEIFKDFHDKEELEDTKQRLRRRFDL